MAELDPAVEKMRQFNLTVLDPAIEKVTQANPKLEEQATALGEMDDEMVGTGNLLGEELETFRSQVEAGAQTAEEAIGLLEKEAQEGATQELPAIGKQLDGAAAAFAEMAETATSEIGQAGAQLFESGFGDAVKDLQAAGASLEDAYAAVDGAFDELQSGAQSLAQDLAAAIRDSAGKAGGAAGEVETHRQTLENEGEGAANAISARCTEQAGAYESLKGELQGYYDEVDGKIESEASTFIECVQKLLQAQAEQAQTKAVEALSEPMGIVVDDCLEPHRQELASWKEAMGKVDPVAEGMTDLVEDLKKAKAVGELVEQATNEL